MPENALNSYLEVKKISTISLKDIESVAKKFSVSKEVITRRLLDISWISKDKYESLTSEIRKAYLKELEMDKIARKQGRGHKIPKSMSREAIDKTSSNICKILSVGYNDGYFSKQDVSGYLGIKEKHIKKFLTEVGKW